MAKVQDVASFFIDLAQKQNAFGAGDLVTNMRLQKLLYFAQGWHLARHGKPLFVDQLHAWQYGPVVKSIYYQYNSFVNGGITTKCSLPDDAFTVDEYSLLLDVVREYDRFSTSELMRLSHLPEAPWSSTRQSTVIPQDKIQAYFSALTPLATFDDILGSYPVHVAERDKNGTVVLPSDWDDGEDYDDI